MGECGHDAFGSVHLVLTMAVGAVLLFLVMAARKWSGRPGKGEEPEMPTWMSAIDSFTPRRSLLLGAALSAANPKNLVLTSAAAASIAQAGLSGGQDSIAIAIFVAIGSVTVVGAVGCYLVAPDRAARPLDSIRAFMAEHNNVIMMVILAILGAKLIGDGLGGLAV